MSWNEVKAGALYKIGVSLEANPLSEQDWPRQFGYILKTVESFASFLESLADDD